MCLVTSACERSSHHPRHTVILWCCGCRMVFYLACRLSFFQHGLS